jgi:hypothetical protein
MRHYIYCYGWCWCIFSWNEEKGSNLRGCKIIRENILIKVYWIIVWVLTSHQLIFSECLGCVHVDKLKPLFLGAILLVCEHRNYQLAWLFLSGILKCLHCCWWCMLLPPPVVYAMYSDCVSLWMCRFYCYRTFGVQYALITFACC